MRRWKGGSKKTVKDLKRHFTRRLGERYSLKIPIETVSGMIRKGQSKPYNQWKNTLNRTHHIVTIDDTEIYVVYDKQRKSVVTALPLSSLKI